jgi:hypothetical protein
MQPRIYTYKVTFEEVRHWYWGVHKEKHFNDGYMGSPVTHKWMWDFYTPKLTILEIFPNTEEGWAEALSVENRLIRPDMDNPFCLNEKYGSFISLSARRKGAERGRQVAHSEKTPEGKSVLGVKNGARLHSEQDSKGRSKAAVKGGQKGGKSVHKRKDEKGKSIQGVANARTLHAQVWESLIDGFRGHIHVVAGHNRRNGWDPRARVRVKLEEQTAPDEA